MFGDLVQQGVTQQDTSVTGAAIVISTFVGWMIIADLVARRSKNASAVLSGRPAIVLRDGEPIEARLSEERMALDDLLGAARAQGFGNLNEIAFGVLEDDGKFSFVPKVPKTARKAPESIAE